MDAFMQPAFESLAAGFPQLIFYLLMVAVIYVLAILIYVRLTPHKELELVQSGNVAVFGPPFLSSFNSSSSA